METINNLANSAAKAVWGDSNTTATNTTAANNETGTVHPGVETTTNETRGTEPVSGKLGDTTKGEPFDAGNMESGATATGSTTANTATNTRHNEGLPADNPSTTSLAGIAIDDTNPQPRDHTAEHTSGTGVTGLPSSHTDVRDLGSNSSVQPSGTTAEHSSTTGASGLQSSHTDVRSTEHDSTVGSKGPTTEHPSSTGDTGFKAAQADVRDPESSSTANPRTETERKNVDDTGGLDKSDNPAKVDGPGPKPIDEVARERGGDAGAINREPATGSAEDTDGPGAKSTGEGTGEQYVKSSGLAADGGDFDATKPGAGKEADRLLEQKGVANPAAAAAAHKDEKHEDEKAASGEKVSLDKSSAGSHDSGDKKPSLKEKIKAKLHKN